MFKKWREHLKEKYQQEGAGRALVTDEELSKSVFDWRFEDAFKDLIFSTKDTWFNLLLFYFASVHVGNKTVKQRWHWNIGPRMFGYWCAFGIGYKYDSDLDILVKKGTE